MHNLYKTIQATKNPEALTKHKLLSFLQIKNPY